MTQTASAKCLCGAVTLAVANVGDSIIACHCGMCRNWGGGPLMTVRCGPDVTIEGEDSLSVYDSSQWADRGFCKHCGTHLFYRFKQSGNYNVTLGLFGDQVEPAFETQVFIDRKPECYSFANETKNMTEAEVIAMFAPKD